MSGLARVYRIAAESVPASDGVNLLVVLTRQNELLEQLLVATQKNGNLLDRLAVEAARKKTWNFAVAQDQFGRPMQIDAKEV